MSSQVLSAQLAVEPRLEAWIRFLRAHASLTRSLSARLEADSYGSAFHEIFQSELPLYVSMDALFHAVYAANDGIIGDLEEGRLAPALAFTYGCRPSWRCS